MRKKFINFGILLIAGLCFSCLTAFAQESEAVVVDEVVAQVNDSVITLSGMKREMQAATEALIKQGKKPEEAKAEVEQKKGELIASLIDEELIMQKGKELNVDADVDAEINQRFLQIMKEQGLKTIEALYKAMNENGIKPEQFRELWRKEITKRIVVQNEVSRKAYFTPSEKEVRAYYDGHKDKFTKPETVTLSELFLSYAGKDMTAVKAKADDLIKQARGGVDFAKLVVENSDRPDAAQTKGGSGEIPVKDLTKQVADAVKDVKEGDVTKFETDEGVEIIRVDKRSAASSQTVFNEDLVRRAMLEENFPAEQKKFLSTLRKDAYIKVAAPYNALVDPLLKDGKTTAETKKSDE